MYNTDPRRTPRDWHSTKVNVTTQRCTGEGGRGEETKVRRWNGMTFKGEGMAVIEDCCVSFLWDTNPIAVYKQVSGKYI